MSDTAPTPVDPIENKKQVFGILSTIFGGLSMLPFLGIISPLGLLLGIMGLRRDGKKLMSIIGTSLSVLGVFTSPLLWAAIAGIWASAVCIISPSSCIVQRGDIAESISAIKAFNNMKPELEQALTGAIDKAVEQIKVENAITNATESTQIEGTITNAPEQAPVENTIINTIQGSDVPEQAPVESIIETIQKTPEQAPQH